MAFKFVALCAFLVSSTNAGVTLTSTSDNTYRSPGNLAQVSTESKSISTPYSSSSNSDVRVHNPSVYVTASPAYENYASSAPAIYAKSLQVQQPINYHAHQPESLTYAQVNIPQSTYYHQQANHPQQHHLVLQQYQPSHQQIYSPGFYNPASQVLPIAHQSHPIYSHAGTSHPVYSHAPSSPLVKVAYSPASEVAHLSYSNINDHINYAW